jgi:hypothetical protein
MQGRQATDLHACSSAASPAGQATSPVQAVPLGRLASIAALHKPGNPDVFLSSGRMIKTQDHDYRS